MTTLIKIKGDLIQQALNGDYDAIVHGCNCYCNMGAGIALTIMRKFPQAFAADERTSKGDPNKIGNYTEATGFSRTSPVKQFQIINAYTQIGCNASQNIDLFEYTGFKLILEKLARRYPNFHFGFPYIGMGLAGGNSTIILDMLEDFAHDVTGTGGLVTLVEYSNEEMVR